ncbi:Wzy polymerase domain-containing protein [Vibrio sp. PP-XX7]
MYLYPLLIISRSVIGWSVTGIGGIVIFPYLYQFASRKRLWGWSISICLGIIVGLTYTQLTYYEAFHKYNLAGVPQLKTSLVQTLDMFIEKPFTGYGYGRFEEEYVLYSARQHQLNPSYPPPQPKLTHPHNELLYWGIEGGILPLIAIALAALFVSFRIHSAKQKTRLASLSLLFPVILHSQLDNVFSLSSIHWITLITLIFWTDQRVAKYRNLPLSTITTKFLYLVLYIVPLAVCLYMAGILRTQFLLSQYDKHHDVTLLDAIHFPFIWEDRLMQDRLALVLKLTDQTQKNRQFTAIYRLVTPLDQTRTQTRVLSDINLGLSTNGRYQSSRADPNRSSLFIPPFLFYTSELGRSRHNSKQVVRRFPTCGNFRAFRIYTADINAW